MHVPVRSDCRFTGFPTFENEYAEKLLKLFAVAEGRATKTQHISLKGWEMKVVELVSRRSS